MEKSCERCYYEKSRYCKICEDYSEFEPICNECDSEVAEYRLEDEIYCLDCIMKELGVEKREVTAYHYYLNDDYVGNDDEYTDSEIINIANRKVKGF